MNIQILKKYNKPGPRYTSYPPATFFHDKFGNEDYKQEIIASNRQSPDNISLYVHIPFCRNLCHFCGCNTDIFREDVFIRSYINALLKEIETVSSLINKNREVTQIHWGGGTPNSISPDYIEEVMDVLKQKFRFAPKIEIAMECNPAYLDFKDIDRLAEMGFNRLSLGVQDFDEKVLKIVNRSLPKYPIADFVKKIKETGFVGVNLDLIYGLPGQTVRSFDDAVKKAIEISPDRLVTFSYAHVPWVKSAQKKLESVGLPSPEEKLDMFDTAYKRLTSSGYVSIGMDHYAKPHDDLSIALENKMLHRNFQGYCTKETTGQVYGFGASSISQLGGAYIQNYKKPDDYMQSIEKQGFAVERGYKLNEVDQVRRSVINEIMCNGFLDFEAIADEFNISAQKVKEITDYQPSKLQKFIDDNLLQINEKEQIKLNPEGFFVVRNIAMEFDPILTQSKMQYSKTV